VLNHLFFEEDHVQFLDPSILSMHQPFFRSAMQSRVRAPNFFVALCFLQLGIDLEHEDTLGFE